MGGSHSVALVGFSAFERSTLQAFFRLAGRRSPSYAHVAEAAQARIVLVDADSAQAQEQAQAFRERCFYIGAHGSDDQLGHMPRPINMMTLLRLLDACVAQLAPHAIATPAPAPGPAVKTAPAPLPAAAPAAPKVIEMAPGRRSVPAACNHDEGPRSEANVNRIDHILVVDDSDIALRFMANCLGRFGFDVHLARSGEDALARVAQTHYEFIFMDVTMPGLDGYQTCKLIKKRPYEPGRRAPAVVMLTSRGGMVDKMRGTLSGCDAYLTKPLQQDALMKVIGDRIVSDVQAADTAATNTF